MLTENPCIIDMIYLHFYKAFDKVDFSKLFHKMKDMGITGKLGKCLQKCQNSKKKINFFPKIFLTKWPFFQKVQIFRKNKIYFLILAVLPLILTTYLPA